MTSSDGWSLPSQTLALVGATIYSNPTDEPIRSGTLVIEDGRILAVGGDEVGGIRPGCATIDCTGLTITAAFWNCHVHFIEPRWHGAHELPAARLAQDLQDMLSRYGFAHAFDTGSDLDNTLAIRARIESGELLGPSIHTTGMPFVAPGGTPVYLDPMRLPELATGEDATQAVHERVGQGAHAIKVYAASPIADGQVAVLPTEVAAAVVTAAHSLGRSVVAHPTSSDGLRVVLDSGIDVLAHTTPDGGERWSDDVVRDLRRAGVALIPTLKLWRWEGERQGTEASAMQDFMQIAQSQLGAYARAGGEILFGTDVGYMTDDDPALEYRLMADAGMDFREILVSLTTAPAARFGRRTGTIAAGMDADLVVLSDDPAAEVEHFAKVVYTLRRGQVIFSAEAEG